jgi:hypothetical protein
LKSLSPPGAFKNIFPINFSSKKLKFNCNGFWQSDSRKSCGMDVFYDDSRDIHKILIFPQLYARLVLEEWFLFNKSLALTDNSSSSSLNFDKTTPSKKWLLHWATTSVFQVVSLSGVKMLLRSTTAYALILLIIIAAKITCGIYSEMMRHTKK